MRINIRGPCREFWNYIGVRLVMLTLGISGPAVAQDLAQDNAAQQLSARQQLQRIHTPQSIDENLVQLREDLELTPEQQKQVRPLPQEDHDKTKRTARFTFCLPITRKNWKRRCNMASVMAKKISDLLSPKPSSSNS
jgi:hypothetical protein